jgi:uncharacterized protein
MDISGFDWDDGNKAKCQKHGVSVFEIEYALLNPLQTFRDVLNSDDEARFRVVAKSTDNRYIFVVFTFRVKQTYTYFRPISARYMHKKEINRYEQRTKTA